MKLIAFILLLFSFFTLNADVQTDPHYLDNELADNRYIIIYIKLHNNIPDENAKAYALVHAAEIARKKGYSYLTLDSMQNIVITRSESLSSAIPGNLFQELIVEGDFRNKAVQNRSKKTLNAYKAIKIYVTFYHDDPKQGEVYEVCNLIFCK